MLLNAPTSFIIFCSTFATVALAAASTLESDPSAGIAAAVGGMGTSSEPARTWPGVAPVAGAFDPLDELTVETADPVGVVSALPVGEVTAPTVALIAAAAAASSAAVAGVPIAVFHRSRERNFLTSLCTSGRWMVERRRGPEVGVGVGVGVGDGFGVGVEGESY